MRKIVRYRSPVTVDDQALFERCARGRVVIIDDDAEILAAYAALIEMEGHACDTYLSALAYLQVLDANRAVFPGPCCVLCDVHMPELGGLELQRRLTELDDTPLLLVSGASGAREVGSAFRAGVQDFLVKPVDADDLLAAIRKAMQVSFERQRQGVRKAELDARSASLTAREREIARRVTRGQTNATIAHELGIALRTVKLHRQRAMEKVGATDTPSLVRIADEARL